MTDEFNPLDRRLKNRQAEANWRWFFVLIIAISFLSVGAILWANWSVNQNQTKLITELIGQNNCLLTIHIEQKNPKSAECKPSSTPTPTPRTLIQPVVPTSQQKTPQRASESLTGGTQNRPQPRPTQDTGLIPDGVPLIGPLL